MKIVYRSRGYLLFEHEYRSVSSLKLLAYSTTVLVRQGVSGAFEVFPLAFPEALASACFSKTVFCFLANLGCNISKKGVVA